MQKHILWKGIEYESLENCLITTTEEGIEISSTIVGQYEGKIYLVDYQIRTNPDWETVFVAIESRINQRVQHWQFEGDCQGNWRKNGKVANQFGGCIDVDIPLSAFTNTLPINRVKLAVGETQLIKVIYLDLLADEFKPVQQKYTRLEENVYHYENVPNDFETDITVDEQGLVVDYPQLFSRRFTL
ncbi:putative glycolipid-binding domain-containing protein [Emticicia fontis]